MFTSACGLIWRKNCGPARRLTGVLVSRFGMDWIGLNAEVDGQADCEIYDGNRRQCVWVGVLQMVRRMLKGGRCKDFSKYSLKVKRSVRVYRYISGSDSEASLFYIHNSNLYTFHRKKISLIYIRIAHFRCGWVSGKE